MRFDASRAVSAGLNKRSIVSRISVGAGAAQGRLLQRFGDYSSKNRQSE
jgi:hypothetical protein